MRPHIYIGHLFKTIPYSRTGVCAGEEEKMRGWMNDEVMCSIGVSKSLYMSSECIHNRREEKSGCVCVLVGEFQSEVSALSVRRTGDIPPSLLRRPLPPL